MQEAAESAERAVAELKERLRQTESAQSSVLSTVVDLTAQLKLITEGVTEAEVGKAEASRRTDAIEIAASRSGTANLLAGLVVEDIVHLGTGVRDVTGLGYALAELHSAGELYVLRAVIDNDYIIVSADIPRRFERQRR